MLSLELEPEPLPPLDERRATAVLDLLLVPLLLLFEPLLLVAFFAMYRLPDMLF